jgi:hypothetical protein
MGKFNVTRWVYASVAAGVLMWVCEGAGSILYMAEMEAVMKAHNLSMEMSTGVLIIGMAVSLIAGFTMMFFYAATLPRLGAGLRTALIVAVALWFGGYLLSLVGYHMLGLFPDRMLAIWGVIGLVEMCLAAMLGAKIYRDA